MGNTEAAWENFGLPVCPVPHKTAEKFSSVEKLEMDPSSLECNPLSDRDTFPLMLVSVSIFLYKLSRMPLKRPWFTPKSATHQASCKAEDLKLKTTMTLHYAVYKISIFLLISLCCSFFLLLLAFECFLTIKKISMSIKDKGVERWRHVISCSFAREE